PMRADDPDQHREHFGDVKAPVLVARGVHAGRQWQAGLAERRERWIKRAAVSIGDLLYIRDTAVGIGLRRVAAVMLGDFEIGAVPLRVLFAALIVRYGFSVHVGGVIALAERIDRDVPVGLDRDAIARDALPIGEEALVLIVELAEPLRQRAPGLRIEVDEDI